MSISYCYSRYRRMVSPIVWFHSRDSIATTLITLVIFGYLRRMLIVATPLGMVRSRKRALTGSSRNMEVRHPSLGVSPLFAGSLIRLRHPCFGRTARCCPGAPKGSRAVTRSHFLVVGYNVRAQVPLYNVWFRYRIGTAASTVCISVSCARSLHYTNFTH